MNSTLIVSLKVILWIICASHLIIGVGLNVSANFPQVVAQLYGATVDWTPEFLYIVKPLGAFMLAMGVLVGVAARNPIGHAPIIYGLVLLLTVRGLQRLVFQDEITTALGVASARNIGNAVFFLAVAAALVLLLRAAKK